MVLIPKLQFKILTFKVIKLCYKKNKAKQIKVKSKEGNIKFLFPNSSNSVFLFLPEMKEGTQTFPYESN